VYRCALAAAAKTRVPEKGITSFGICHQTGAGQRGECKRLSILDVCQTRSFLLRPKLLYNQIGVVLRKNSACYLYSTLVQSQGTQECKPHKGHPWAAAVNAKYKTQVKSCLPGDTGALELRRGRTQRWHPPASSR